MAEIKTYRDRIAWQRAMDRTARGYHWTGDMPAEERFGLTSQIRRAPAPVPSNIAEGGARGQTTDCLRMLRIARGSLAEASTQVELIERLNMLAPDSDRRGLLGETHRVLRGLIRGIQRL